MIANLCYLFINAFLHSLFEEFVGKVVPHSLSSLHGLSLVRPCQ